MRIPDCFFLRRKDEEERYGYVLAGILIVRRPKDRGFTKKMQKAVRGIVNELLRTSRTNPDLHVVLANLDGSKPGHDDKINDDAWLVANYHLPDLIKIEVRLDPGEPSPDDEMPERLSKELRRRFSN